MKNQANRFKNYIQKISGAYPDVKVQIDETIRNDLSFSAVIALNVFRILQESFTNALKHSHCNNIRVCIACDESMNISVEDNGIGIDESKFKKGNGITNMQARAKDSGFTLIIDGRKDGTVVKLIFSPGFGRGTTN